MAPTFGRAKELARYVDELHRNNGYPAVAAFLDPPAKDPAKEYLSVNSLEVESLANIATYYRARFQNGKGDVAVASRKVFHYTEAAKKAGIDLVYDKSSMAWRFNDFGGKTADAFELIPAHDKLKSPSHAGVHFIRALKEHDRAKFARRIANKRFHLVRA